MCGMEHDYSKWKMKLAKSFESFDALLAEKSFPDGIYATTLAEGHVFDFMVRSRKSNLGVIVFNARTNRKEHPLPPVLYGQGIAAGANATLISISDLALTYGPDIEMGWHAGATGVPLQEMLPKLFDHLRASLGIEKLILFGGSAGGFASLYYGNIMDNVLPIAANPQTRICDFYLNHVTAYAKGCWGWDGSGDVANFLESRIEQSLLEVYQRNPKPFLYLQNESDWHVEKHTLPFMRALGNHQGAVSSKTGQGFVRFVNWGEGHASISKDTAIDVLTKAFAWQGSWADYIASLTE